MKDGAKVFDVGVSFLKSLRCCLGAAPEGACNAGNEPLDWVLPCKGGVGRLGIADVEEEKMADFGLAEPVVAGETEEVLAKGLLRRCAVLLALNAMAERLHQRIWGYREVKV